MGIFQLIPRITSLIYCQQFCPSYCIRTRVFLILKCLWPEGFHIQQRIIRYQPYLEQSALHFKMYCYLTCMIWLRMNEHGFEFPNFHGVRSCHSQQSPLIHIASICLTVTEQRFLIEQNMYISCSLYISFLFPFTACKKIHKDEFFRGFVGQ